MEIINLKSSKNSILYAQRLLAEQGYPLVPNGHYDEKTRLAIVDFQSRHQLEADGIIGYHTWEVLLLAGHKVEKRLTENDFILAAQLLDIETAILKAIQKIETGGRGGFFAPGKPAILFEGHIFWEQLRKRNIDPWRYVKGNENILYPTWTKKHYIGGIGEYKRLEQARRIHVEAADASASWGMFQLMGFNYSACGEKSVKSFVNAMCESEFSQLMRAARFIRNSGMLPALREHEWRTFARLFNGPGYEKNDYHDKFEAAYTMFAPGVNKTT